MDLVNIIYRYVQRFINSEELINQLENIDKSKFSLDEVTEIDKLLEEVKKIIETIPNEIDKFEENKLKTINRMLEIFKKNQNNKNLDEEGKEFVEKQYNSMLEEKEKVRDSGPRYEKLFKLLTHFPVYNKYCSQMDDLALLEFITNYISVPLPPPITQEAFDDLVSAGIKEDKKESLWRLAMNYNYKNKDFSKIEDYFILKRDSYYLAELISGVNEDLDLDRLIDKVLKTNDLEFIKKLVCTEYIQDIFNETQKEKVKNYLEKYSKRKD